MYFTNFTDLMYMNGHGFYVWLAFGFSIFWLGYLLLNPVLKKKRLLKAIETQLQVEENRKRSN